MTTIKKNQTLEERLKVLKLVSTKRKSAITSRNGIIATRKTLDK